MKFKLENTLASPLETVEELMFSAAYYEFLKKSHSGVDNIEVLEQKVEPERIRRQVKYTPKPIIEKVGPKRVPREAMVFVEHSTYERRTRTLTFENRPLLDWVQRRLSNQGTIRLVAEGARTQRIVEGELIVKFPLLGAIAERIIFSQARKLLEEEVECFKRYLDSEKAKG